MSSNNNISSVSRSDPTAVERVIDFFKSSTLRGRAVQLITGLACLALGYFLIRLIVQRVFKQENQGNEVSKIPHPEDKPLPGGKSYLATLEYDALFEIFQHLDAKSVYSCSVTCKHLSAPFKEDVRIKLVIEKYMPRWIEDCAKEKWRSKAQEAKVSAIFKMLTLLPQSVIFPEPEAPTIPLMRKMFQIFESKIHQGFYSDPLTDKLHAIKEKLYQLEGLHLYQHSHPKLERFLRNLPTVWLVGHANVTSVQEMSRRHDQGLLTEDDQKTLRQNYSRGVQNFGLPFLVGASDRFFQAVLTTYCLRHGIDGSNIFFVDGSLNWGFERLFHQDEQIFRQKFSILLDFYDNHMQRGTAQNFEAGKKQTLDNIYYILLSTLRKDSSHNTPMTRPLPSVLCYFLDRHPDASSLLRPNPRVWIDHLKSYIVEHAAFNLPYSTNQLVDQVETLERLVDLILVLENKIEALPRPTPPVFSSFEDLATCEFTVKFENESYPYQSKKELVKHSKYFLSQDHFVKTDRLILVNPDGLSTEHVHLALRYLQGEDIVIDETCCLDLLRVSEYLHIDRLSFLCQRMAIRLFLEDRLEIDNEAVEGLPSDLRQFVQLYSPKVELLAEARD